MALLHQTMLWELILKKVQVVVLTVTAVLVMLVFPALPAAAAEPSGQLEIFSSDSTDWAIGLITPGQSITKTVTIQNTGSSSGNLSIWLNNIQNIDGTPDKFEEHTPGDLGELGSFLTLKLISRNVTSNIQFPAITDDFPHSASDSSYIKIGSLEAREKITLEWECNLPLESGNIIQGDSLSFDINYLFENLPSSGDGGQEEVESTTRVCHVSAIGGIITIRAATSPALTASNMDFTDFNSIEVHNLTITTGIAQPEQSITVRGEAVNTGRSSGEQTVLFSISGVVQDRLIIKLAPGQRRELSYSLTPAGPGEYDIQLGDNGGLFTFSDTDTGMVTMDKSNSIALTLFRSLWDVNNPPVWWATILGLEMLMAIVIFFPGRRRYQVFVAETAKTSRYKPIKLETSKAASGKLTMSAYKPKSRKPVVESITGPTRRLKSPGPYKYAIKIVGGKPPYTVEWSGNKVIYRGENYEQVELFREHTLDSGKGNWVFIQVKDSAGKYAQWLDSNGSAKRIFTYGITYRNKVVTTPDIFPYQIPTDG